MSTQPNEQPSLRSEHIHPKYAGFMLIMAGPLLKWPTLLTLLMFPILITMYVRLGRCKERKVTSQNRLISWMERMVIIPLMLLTGWAN